MHSPQMDQIFGRQQSANQKALGRMTWLDSNYYDRVLT